MIDLKLSRQLLKSIYLKKMEYEKCNSENITMSEFIEECLMEYLNISIVDINDEKVPIKLDMYYDGSIYTGPTTDITDITDTITDTEVENEISFTNYVYVYMNPFKKLDNEIILDISGEKFIFDYEPFYIGKGNRIFDHLKSKNDVNSNKLNLINEIIDNGKEPIVRIIKNELTEYEAYSLENIIITKLNNLTNISGGKSNKTEYTSSNKKTTLEYDKNKYILSLISKGLKNKEISELAGISERTLYRMKSNLKTKKVSEI